MNRLNKTESAVFLYCRSSLFLKDSFSRLFRGRKSCRCFCVELVKVLPVHRYNVDIFSYSGPWGILKSNGKQNTAKAAARGRENRCTFH